MQKQLIVNTILKYQKIILKFFVILYIFILPFCIYQKFRTTSIGGDTVSLYYPAKYLIEKNNLNFWNSLNDRYQTYYFSLTFNDITIQKWGNSYPMQTPGAIMITAFFLKIFNDNGIFYMPIIFGLLTLYFTYLIINKLNKNTSIGIITIPLLFSMPVFIQWAIVPQNISITTFFLIASIFYMILYQENKKVRYLLISGILFSICGWIRLPHFIFIIPYLIFFINNKRFQYKDFIIFCIPLLLTTILVMLFNKIYYTDMFYLGYLKNENHPYPPGYNMVYQQPIQRILFQGIKPSMIIQSITKFFKGISVIYFQPFIICLLSFFIVSKNKINKFKIFFITSLILMLIYYGNLEPLLYRESGYPWFLPAPFFRYLLPIFIMSVIMISFFINKLTENSTKIIKLSITFFIFIYSIQTILLTYSYMGGASLKYQLEIDQSVKQYSYQLLSSIKNDAIILYADRWPFSYTFPKTMNYNWFFYDGVPPKVRYSHTKEVVQKALNDDKIIYFIHQDEPYNELSKNMELYLKQYFTFIKVEGTEYPRMKTIFYQLINNKLQ